MEERQRIEVAHRRHRSEVRGARVLGAGLLALAAAVAGACKKKAIDFDAAPVAIDARPIDAAVEIDAAKAAAAKPVADKLAIGATAACMVMSDQSVRCWGANTHGQLGIGTTAATTGLATPAVRGVVDLQMAGDTACALLADGSVACWGHIAWEGAKADTLAPVGPPGVKKIKQLYVGERSACGRVEDGSLLCWGGVDPSGRASAATADARHYPTPLAAPKGFAAIAETGVELGAQGGMVCMRDDAGKVRCVGDKPACMAPKQEPKPVAPPPPPKKSVKKGKAGKKPAPPPPPPPPDKDKDKPAEPDDFTLALPPALRLAFAGRDQACVVTRTGALACGDGCAAAKLDGAFAATAAIVGKLTGATALAIDPATGRGCAITSTLHEVACWEAGATSTTPVAY